MGEEASSSRGSHFGLASEMKVWLCSTQTEPRTNPGGEKGRKTQVFTNKCFALKSPRGDLFPLRFGKERTCYRPQFYPSLFGNFYSGKPELNSDSTGHGAHGFCPRQRLTGCPSGSPRPRQEAVCALPKQLIISQAKESISRLPTEGLGRLPSPPPRCYFTPSCY